MRNAGMLVEPLEKFFDSQTPDHVWLEETAKRGWIALSKDQQIMSSELSVRTTIDSGARLFICIGTYGHGEVAENVIRARHKLELWARRRGTSFIARLYMSPKAQGERRRRKPGEIKPFDHERFLLRYK